MSNDPLLVLFYGGPGSGKSTWTTGTFAEAKLHGFNAELVHEAAKDFTWEGRWKALGHQPYLISKQMFWFDRLYGKVDVIFSDTSTLFGLIYGKTPQSFKDWVLEDFRSRRTLNILVTRSPGVPYQAHGRRQSEASARAMDDTVIDLLERTETPYSAVMPGVHDFECVLELVRAVGVQPCV